MELNFWDCFRRRKPGTILSKHYDISGGKLKTLAEQDSESLQANLFTVEQIEMRMIPLRLVS